MREEVKQSLGLCLLLGFLFCAAEASMPIFRDTQLFEGSTCTFANGEGNGTCVNLKECEHQKTALLSGHFNPRDRCLFYHDEDIVCCRSVKVRQDPNDEINESPTDAACAEYGNEVLPPEVSFHILGGENATSTEFPYMVALGYTARPDDNVPGGISYTCGGTLISLKHVLTAAHCVSNRDERMPVEVRLGSINLVENEETMQRVKVASSMPHPGYRRSANYDDIAIVTLVDPVRITPAVRPACLLTRSKHTLNPAENETLVVVGWGVTSIEGEETKQLKKAAGLVFYDSNECDEKYEYVKATRLTRGVDEKMLCVIDANRTRKADACQGDSGGPLLLFSGSSYKLAGVTAFGQACGSTIPAVYMSVYSYMDWIEDQVWPKVKNTQ